jgi:hypothetical protein
MNLLLDKLIALFFAVCPSLARRMDVAIRARLHYKYLFRDKPSLESQIVGRHSNVSPRKMWRRHLNKYLEVYDRARIPVFFAKTEDVRRHDTK